MASELNENLSQFTDRKSQPTTYAYDALNRRTQATYGDLSTTAYTYDKGNRLLQVNDSIAGIITRTYDGLNRLTSETTPQGSVSYTYDAAGRRASMTVSGQPAITYTYDNANRLLQITQGTSVVTFGYDSAGRRTSFTLPNGILVQYAYDAASRVISVTYKQGLTVLGDLTYEYDKAGNRTKVGGSFARTGIPAAVASSTYNAANQQTALADKNMTFDQDGNLTSITDTNGTVLYTWNARNQMAGISGPSLTASFVYDGLGRREKKTINGGLTEFLFDGVNPVQETSGPAVLANILTGLGIDEYFSRTDVPSGTTSHYFADALGSTIALADSAGAVQTEYTYEPFGRTTATGAGSFNPFHYTGRESDGTDFYYYRARNYHPGLQRFISEDPIEFLAGDANLYTYVGDNPVNRLDPSGLFTISIGVKVTAAALAGGGGGTLINIGFGRNAGFTFSVTGTAEGGVVTGGALSLQGVLQFTKLESVSLLTGPFLLVGKSIGVQTIGGGDVIFTESGQAVGFDIFGGVGFRLGKDLVFPVLTTSFYSTTSTIFSLGGRK